MSNLCAATGSSALNVLLDSTIAEQIGKRHLVKTGNEHGIYNPVPLRKPPGDVRSVTATLRPARFGRDSPHTTRPVAAIADT